MADMITHSEKPLNAEPKPQELVKNDVTPIDLFYHRNHGPVPRDAEAAVQGGPQDIDSWEVSFEAEAGVLEAGASQKRLSLAELKDKYDSIEEDIALQVSPPLFPSLAILCLSSVLPSAQETDAISSPTRNPQRKVFLGKNPPSPTLSGKAASFAPSWWTSSLALEKRKVRMIGTWYSRVARIVARKKAGSLEEASLEELRCKTSRL